MLCYNLVDKWKNYLTFGLHKRMKIKTVELYKKGTALIK